MKTPTHYKDHKIMKLLTLILLLGIIPNMYANNLEQAKRTFLLILDHLEQSGDYQRYVNEFVKTYGGTKTPMKLPQFGLQLTQAPNSVGYHNTRLFKLWWRANLKGSTLNNILKANGIQVTNLNLEELGRIEDAVYKAIDNARAQEIKVIQDLAEDIDSAKKSPLTKMDGQSRGALFKQFGAYEKALMSGDACVKNVFVDYGIAHGSSTSKVIIKGSVTGAIGVLIALDVWMEWDQYQGNTFSYTSADYLTTPELMSNKTEITEMYMEELYNKEPEKLEAYMYRLNDQLCELRQAAADKG